MPITPYTRRSVTAGTLEVDYLTCGAPHDRPVVLVHGFPYAPAGYADIAPRLADAGAYVVVPFMRGYGGTRFRSPRTLRSGAQGAFGADLLALLDALRFERADLGGFDWGGRAACIVAALWPERVTGLVTCGGYNIQDIPNAGEPGDPASEHRLWYQYYFHGERGRAGLERHRREFCRLLWTLWSPTWRFDDATFEASAAAFNHPDFVEVVIHSYRHRYGLVAGDPAHDDIEARLAVQPAIRVPTIALHGGADGVARVGGPRLKRECFTGSSEHRILDGIGHNVPQEAPDDFTRAVLDLRAMDESR